jgi:hypothetical protein
MSLESAVSESESVRLVEAASLEFYPAVAETMTEAGARDQRFSAGAVGRAARLAVTAWARAVDGDEAALAGMDPNNAYFLLHPPYKSWQVAPGPRVTQIEVTRLNTQTRATQIPVEGYETEPPLVMVEFRFQGRRRSADPGAAGDADTLFAARLELRLTSSGAWHLHRGYIETLDDYLGYTFTSRRETPEEYRQRAGWSAAPPAAGQPREFRITAGFTEDDVKFGSETHALVQTETAPTREEAAELVRPAVWEATRRALGEGDWQPTIRRIVMTELLGG